MSYARAGSQDQEETGLIFVAAVGPIVADLALERRGRLSVWLGRTFFRQACFLSTKYALLKAGRAGMHLLLVEDNPADAFLVRMAVEPAMDQGVLQCTTVTDGAQALAFLHQQEPYMQAAAPDLVLLDLNLPVKSGSEVLAELHQDPKLHSIPVVVLTSSANPQDRSQCYGLGARAYLVKPMELEEFLSLVQSVVAFWGAVTFPRAKTEFPRISQNNSLV